MKHLVSRELHDYWDRLRGARAAPERSDLDPAAIRSILADTFLVEVAGGPSFEGRDFVIRLSGTRLNALWGADLKGRSLLSLWQRQDRAAVSDLLDLVLDDQIPVIAGSHDAVSNKVQVELELLLLPLRHHGKTHARLMGSITPILPPRWMDVEAIGELTLTSFRSIHPASVPRFRGQAAAVPISGSTSTRYGRFTVYEGGR